MAPPASLDDETKAKVAAQMLEDLGGHRLENLPDADTGLDPRQYIRRDPPRRGVIVGASSWTKYASEETKANPGGPADIAGGQLARQRKYLERALNNVAPIELRREDGRSGSSPSKPSFSGRGQPGGGRGRGRGGGRGGHVPQRPLPSIPPGRIASLGGIIPPDGNTTRFLNSRAPSSNAAVPPTVSRILAGDRFAQCRAKVAADEGWSVIIFDDIVASFPNKPMRPTATIKVRSRSSPRECTVTFDVVGTTTMTFDARLIKVARLGEDLQMVLNVQDHLANQQKTIGLKLKSQADARKFLSAIKDWIPPIPTPRVPTPVDPRGPLVDLSGFSHVDQATPVEDSTASGAVDLLGLEFSAAHAATDSDFEDTDPGIDVPDAATDVNLEDTAPNIEVALQDAMRELELAYKSIPQQDATGSFLELLKTLLEVMGASGVLANFSDRHKAEIMKLAAVELYKHLALWIQEARKSTTRYSADEMSQWRLNAVMPDTLMSKMLQLKIGKGMPMALSPRSPAQAKQVQAKQAALRQTIQQSQEKPDLAKKVQDKTDQDNTDQDDNKRHRRTDTPVLRGLHPSRHNICGRDLVNDGYFPFEESVYRKGFVLMPPIVTAPSPRAESVPPGRSSPLADSAHPCKGASLTESVPPPPTECIPPRESAPLTESIPPQETTHLPENVRPPPTGGKHGLANSRFANGANVKNPGKFVGA